MQFLDPPQHSDVFIPHKRTQFFTFMLVLLPRASTIGKQSELLFLFGTGIIFLLFNPAPATSCHVVTIFGDSQPALLSPL